METERERAERIIMEMARAKDVGDTLKYNRDTKSFESGSTVDPDNLTRTTPEDMVFFSGRRQ